MTPDDIKDLSVKNTLVYWILTTEAQISLRFALRPAVFEIHVFWKSECTEWPQNDLKDLSVKSTLCTQNTNALNDPRMTLRT